MNNQHLKSVRLPKFIEDREVQILFKEAQAKAEATDGVTWVILAIGLSGIAFSLVSQMIGG